LTRAFRQRARHAEEGAVRNLLIFFLLAFGAWEIVGLSDSLSS
jgi:hypothetical protein